MTRTQVIVLGAGIVGTSVALQLAKRGVAVTLVDKRGPGEETSYGNVSFVGDVAGPFLINYSSTGACDNNGWAAAGDAAATAAGYNLSQYSHKVYVIPSQNTCSWATPRTVPQCR